MPVGGSPFTLWAWLRIWDLTLRAPGKIWRASGQGDALDLGLFFLTCLIMKHFLRTEECKNQYNRSPLTRHHDETDVNDSLYFKQISCTCSLSLFKINFLF